MEQNFLVLVVLGHWAMQLWKNHTEVYWKRPSWRDLNFPTLFLNSTWCSRLATPLSCSRAYNLTYSKLDHLYNSSIVKLNVL